MMKLAGWKLLDWLTLVWCGTCIFIAFLGIYPGFETSWCWAARNASNIASWVQAVGSIAAIWGAFKVANLQFVEARERDAAADAVIAAAKLEDQRQEKRRKYMLLYDRFHACTTMVEAINNESLQKAIEIEVAIVAVNDYLNLVNSITMDQVPDLELVVDVSNFRIRLEVLKYQLLNCAASLKTWNNHQEHCKYVLDAVAKVVQWGKNSRDTCERRLRESSKEIELSEVFGHFGKLKAAAAQTATPPNPR